MFRGKQEDMGSCGIGSIRLLDVRIAKQIAYHKSTFGGEINGSIEAQRIL